MEERFVVLCPAKGGPALLARRKPAGCSNRRRLGEDLSLTHLLLVIVSKIALRFALACGLRNRRIVGISFTRGTEYGRDGLTQIANRNRLLASS
jgi:hypothetical protein